jgi:hypothetical protein
MLGIYGLFVISNIICDALSKKFSKLNRAEKTSRVGMQIVVALFWVLPLILGLIFGIRRSPV